MFQCRSSTLLALFQSLTTILHYLYHLRPPPIYLLANMSSPSSVSSATLPFIAPFIADETQTKKTSGDGNPDRNSSIAAGKSKSGFKAFKIGVVLLLLVFPLLQNFRALLFLHHHQLQKGDRYKEELMDLPVQQSRSIDVVDIYVTKVTLR